MKALDTWSLRCNPAGSDTPARQASQFRELARPSGLVSPHSAVMIFTK